MALISAGWRGTGFQESGNMIQSGTASPIQSSGRSRDHDSKYAKRIKVTFGRNLKLLSTSWSRRSSSKVRKDGRSSSGGISIAILMWVMWGTSTVETTMINIDCGQMRWKTSQNVKAIFVNRLYSCCAVAACENEPFQLCCSGWQTQSEWVHFFFWFCLLTSENKPFQFSLYSSRSQN